MFPELKPYLTALVMPPASLLALIFFGSLFIKSNAKLARKIILSSVVTLWLLSTSGFSELLHHLVIPEYPTITAKALKESSVQAVVVLGAGVVTGLPNGDHQLTKNSLERLRLGAQLARQSGLPLVVSGGSGWGAMDTTVSEAEISEEVLRNAFGIVLNYKESNSRDTQENAANSWTLLSKKGLTKIALVTHATHMPRASLQFTEAGFEVTEAAVGQLTSGNFTTMSWLPGASNLELSQSVLRELLARLIQKLNFH